MLAIDIYEHAYHIDFGANVTAYIAAFMRNIDWKAVEQRYENALQVAPPPRLVQPEFAGTPSVTVEEVQELLKSGQRVQIIDARPRHYIAKADHGRRRLARSGTHRRLDRRAVEGRTGHHVLRLCFYIGCQTATALRDKGFDAKYMAGGHFGWKAKKGAMKLLGA